MKNALTPPKLPPTRIAPWARRLCSCLLLLAAGIPSRLGAAENWMFSTPEPLPSPINLPNSWQATPWLSADGRTLYFGSDRPGGMGEIDLWVSERSSVNDPWGAPTNLGPPINTSRTDLGPSLSADGLTLYFMDGNPYGVSPRAGGPGNYQIWTSTRATKQSPWETPVDLKAPVGSPVIESYPFVTADGLALYFTSNRSTPAGLFVSQRATVDDPWLTPVNLGPRVNQGTWSGFPYESSSGLHLLFYSDRPGGRGGFDLWMSARASVDDAWAAPINLGPQVNGPYLDVSPCVSADFPALGSYLLFARNDLNGWNRRFKIYQAVVIPNLSLLRSTSLEGPWIPMNASFMPTSENTILVDGPLPPSSPQSFYRVILNSDTGSVQLLSAEPAGARLLMRLHWVL